jgi:hypothetical protein
MNRYEQIVVRRIVEVRSEMLDAIHANDINQYDMDIQAMRHTIDELLDLLVDPAFREWALANGYDETAVRVDA